MQRTRHYWALFFAALLLGAGALGRLSRHLWQLDQQHKTAIAQADLQERIRLSLWRVDFAASSLLLQETARPPEQFSVASAVWSTTLQSYGNEVLPSPLLTESQPGVRLHFELSTSGNLTSPNCASPEELSQWSGRVTVDVGKNNEKLAELRSLLTPTAIQQLRNLHPQFAANMVNETASVNLNNVGGNLADPARQREFNKQEMTQRSNMKAGSEQQTIASRLLNNGQSTLTPLLQVSSYQSLWIGEQLLLIRRVAEGKTSRMQGLWLDWPTLQQTWLALIRDLLPTAALQPTSTAAASSQDPYLLAQLPLKLMPGAPPASPQLKNSFTQMLAFCWLAAALAAAAVGLLLHRSLALSDRRAAFVSAVTHELRTPLTTFRLYTEMLVEDMIPEPAQRKLYLETLHQEAGRLNHLVENVLSFARLEQASARSRVETASVGEHLEHLLPRLRQRAGQEDMTINFQLSPSLAQKPWSVDVTSLEQILLNLVDNVLKYCASTNTMDLLVSDEKSKRVITLRDYGPGIAPNVKKHLFKPFHKSADEAARTAPGIGLGLSLSRRLARQMGGDLRHTTPTDGTSGSLFSLELPI